MSLSIADCCSDSESSLQVKSPSRGSPHLIMQSFCIGYPIARGVKAGDAATAVPVPGVEAAGGGTRAEGVARMPAWGEFTGTGGRPKWLDPAPVERKAWALVLEVDGMFAPIAAGRGGESPVKSITTDEGVGVPLAAGASADGAIAGSKAAASKAGSCDLIGAMGAA